MKEVCCCFYFSTQNEMKTRKIFVLLIKNTHKRTKKKNFWVSMAEEPPMQISVYVGRQIPPGETSAPRLESDLKKAAANEIKDVTDLNVAQTIPLEKDFLIYAEKKNDNDNDDNGAVLIGKIHEVPAATKGLKSWLLPGSQVAFAVVTTLVGLANKHAKSNEKEDVPRLKTQKIYNDYIDFMSRHSAEVRERIGLLLAVVTIALYAARIKSLNKFFNCKYQWMDATDKVTFFTKTKVTTSGAVVTETSTGRTFRLTFITKKKNGTKMCLVIRDDGKDKKNNKRRLTPLFTIDMTQDKSQWDLSKASNQKKSIFIPLVLTGKGTFNVPSTDLSGAQLTPEMQQLYIFAHVLFEFRNKTTATAVRRALSFFNYSLSAMALEFVFRVALDIGIVEYSMDPINYLRKKFGPLLKQYANK